MYGGYAETVPADTLLAQTLGRAHSCDVSSCMEATQRRSRLTLCRHRHSAGPTAAMGHHIWTQRRDSPGQHSAGTDTQPGPRLQWVTIFEGDAGTVLAGTLLAWTLGWVHSCDGSPYMEGMQRWFLLRLDTPNIVLTDSVVFPVFLILSD